MSPAYPMIVEKGMKNDTGAKGSGWIERASRIIDAGKLCDEQCKPYTDRSDESRFVLFGCKHEDCKDKLKGAEHLNEEALSNGCPWV